MRGKFSGPCIPDPSVPKIVVTDAWLQDMLSRLPEMPSQKAARFLSEYGLTSDEASNMSQEQDLSEFFEAVANENLPPRKVASWMATHLIPFLKDNNQTIKDTPLTPKRFASLLSMLETDVINANAAKEVLTKLLSSDQSPEEIVEKGRFRQVSDNAELEALIDRILADHLSDVEDFRNGNTKVMGFFMGLAMKASQGKANPKVLKEILTKRLS